MKHCAVFFVFHWQRHIIKFSGGKLKQPLPINDTLCISKQQSPSFMARRKSYWRDCLGCNEVSGSPCLCWGDNILNSFGSRVRIVNKTEIIHCSPMKSHMELAGHLAADEGCLLSDYPRLGYAGERRCGMR